MNIGPAFCKFAVTWSERLNVHGTNAHGTPGGLLYTRANAHGTLGGLMYTGANAHVTPERLMYTGGLMCTVHWAG